MTSEHWFTGIANALRDETTVDIVEQLKIDKIV